MCEQEQAGFNIGPATPQKNPYNIAVSGPQDGSASKCYVPMFVSETRFSATFAVLV